MRKFEENITIDLEEIGCVGADGSIWFGMTSDWLL
jgi:hypothetical protein